MRLNVDSLFLRDPRVKRLAMLVKRHERHVRGDLLEIWEVCFLRRSAVLEALDIDAQGELEGYSNAMVRAGLATDTPDGIRVHGVEDRLRWLVAQDAKRQKANDTRNGKRDNKEPPRGVPESDARDSRGDFPSEIWDLRSEIRDPECSELPKRAEPRARPRAKQKAPPAEGHAETVEAFTVRYVNQSGVKPTWGAKQGAMVSRLIKLHGATEVQRRIALLFDGLGPAFLSPPHDLETLVQHFDKLAVPTQQRSTYQTGFDHVMNHIASELAKENT